MTDPQFDASASSTPRRPAALSVQNTAPGTVDRRMVRLVWLTAVFVRREAVSFEKYHRRFGVRMRTFRRDIAAIRDAGLYVDAQRGGYRMTCFFADADAA